MLILSEWTEKAIDRTWELYDLVRRGGQEPAFVGLTTHKLLDEFVLIQARWLATVGLRCRSYILVSLASHLGAAVRLCGEDEFDKLAYLDEIFDAFRLLVDLGRLCGGDWSQLVQVGKVDIDWLLERHTELVFKRFSNGLSNREAGELEVVGCLLDKAEAPYFGEVEHG